MCGLVGAVARRDVMPILLDGLKRLEYRGYDSAGLAFITGASTLGSRRCVGKVGDLEKSLAVSPLSSSTGIGHTRWATHGEPEERNAHPHLSHDSVAVVHNGIIENYEVLRKILEGEGYRFQSDTDTEVVAHLVHLYLKRNPGLFEAVQDAAQHLTGAYAIAVMAVSEPDCLVVARQDSPLVIGVGDGEHFVASDTGAMLPVTRNFIFLEDGDVAELRRGDLTIVDSSRKRVQRPPRQLEMTNDLADKGSYAHFMLKEICEQPRALIDTFEGRIVRDALMPERLGLRMTDLLERVRSIHLVACGTSLHAAEAARYWIESSAGLACTTDYASEYRYRSPVVPPDCLFIALSQSGETADTLAALRYARAAGYLATLAICNVAESSLVREADMTLLTRAGPEIGVASTKAFTTQLASLLMLTGLFARCGRTPGNEQQRFCRQLLGIPASVQYVLDRQQEIEEAARFFIGASHAFFLGRGSMVPIAREGALKLKEISYIHAEAYPAGELKHGPLALIDAQMLTVILAPSNRWLDKTRHGLREIQARGGQLLVLTDAASGIEPAPGLTRIRLPEAHEMVAPLTYSVALQLLAYFAAVQRGTDVDQPRNLAKSVTVE